jgi:hypothetical protein
LLFRGEVEEAQNSSPGSSAHAKPAAKSGRGRDLALIQEALALLREGYGIPAWLLWLSFVPEG